MALHSEQTLEEGETEENCLEGKGCDPPNSKSALNGYPLQVGLMCR